MTPRNSSSISFVFLACILATSPARAHGDLHKRIAKISKQIRALATPAARAPLLVKRAELHRLHRDWPAARRDFAAARAAKGHLPWIDFLEGRMAAQASQPLVALRFLNAQLTAAPDHISSRLWRGRVLDRLGRYAQAVADFDVVLQRTTRPSVDHYLDRARIQLRSGLPVKAVLRGVEAGVKKLGPLVSLQEFAVELAIEHAMYEHALRCIGSVLPTLPLRSPWLERRAQVLLRQGHRRRARDTYLESLAELDRLPRRNAYQRDLRSRIHTALRRLR